MMPSLLRSIAGSVVRNLLVSVGAVLVARGYVSQSDWDELIIGLGMAVAAVIWSLWQKYGSHLLVLAALKLPANSTLDQAAELAKRENSSAKLLPLLVIAALGASTVACAKVKGAETAVYSAQTAAAWQGVQGVVVILDDNDVVEPGAFYLTHGRVTDGLETLFNRLETGGYEKKDVLVLLDQIAADTGQLEQDLQLVRDPGSKEKLTQVLFSVRFGLNSIRAIVAATKRPDPAVLASARSSRPTTRALWWNDVMTVVTNTFIRTTYQSEMAAPAAWTDARAILAEIREVNAAKTAK